MKIISFTNPSNLSEIKYDELDNQLYVKYISKNSYRYYKYKNVEENIYESLYAQNVINGRGGSEFNKLLKKWNWTYIEIKEYEYEEL